MQIVFIHRGRSWYLPYALYQAKAASPGSDIILLGDGFTGEGIQVHSLQNLQTPNIQKFKKHYIHMSSNTVEFESFCWLKYFYLLEYMRKNQVKFVLYLDSDVLLYSSIEEIKKAYPETFWSSGCGVSMPKQDFESFTWCASGHISYWTYELLEEFCEFILNSFIDNKYLGLYRGKFNWHLAKKKPGGICDMTTIYLFWNENKDRVQNMLINHNGNVFDDNINTATNYYKNEFVFDSGTKKVKFIDGHPHFLSADGTNTSVRAHALHFQGVGKKYMPDLYTGRPLRGITSNNILSALRAIKRIARNRLNRYFGI
ncbi:MAG TPA: hypothetical protein DER10_03630 [Elusimicrobia bacterium]|nr:MAG: hypothetical protein A2X33_04195 [Elusimicrobia bacterium GWA2_51_34]HAF96490.1 hypothetical protein [Elusimicrobiota bacterium]HCE97569.1 hypothetical protein [Elusimicrobiota bacterium]